ncbi:MAG: shikimate dehydrogenase [Bacteroidetes bacterium]|nr:MAG: shikimate dehydrogenase [Bacteroidota bacterium]
MKVFGLIGYPLEHSWSPAFFQRKFRENGLDQCTYRLFPLKVVDEFPFLLNRMSELCGVNVTIPYKEAILPFLDELDPVAAEIGAVNTIRISGPAQERKLIGYNTDAEGFQQSADFSGYRVALILGTGGAAKAVAYVLRELCISYLFVSRNPSGENMVDYQDLSPDLLKQFILIINTTPLGMYPDENTAPPILYDQLTANHFLYDLVYNPQETRFLKNGARQGARTQSGLKMLYLQAEAAFRIFTRE